MARGWYERLSPLFFRIPPELAHALGLFLMARIGDSERRRAAARRRWPRVDDPVDVLGLRFPNRVGLAAGYDKDAVAWKGLATLGFGHLELGTVTPQPQPGNPRPRVFRLTRDQGLINRLGFPSQGAQAMLKRLQAEGGDPEASGMVEPVLGINIGKQKETELTRAVEDYCGLVRDFAPLADYLAVNISSPNTPELRRLQTPEFLGSLVRGVVAERNRSTREVGGAATPLLVKIAPDLETEDLNSLLATLVEAGADGLIATNTTLAREGLESKHRNQVGGASGRPLSDLSLRVIEHVARRLEGRVPLIAVGGIFSGEDAKARLDAGADLVQLYTGLVYRGPALIGEVARSLGQTKR